MESSVLQALIASKLKTELQFMKNLSVFLQAECKVF